VEVLGNPRNKSEGNLGLCGPLVLPPMVTPLVIKDSFVENLTLFYIMIHFDANN